MNVEIGTVMARFLFWEYINWIFFAVQSFSKTVAFFCCKALNIFRNKTLTTFL